MIYPKISRMWQKVYTKDIHELIHFADFAMYQAKEQGKNQYKLFSQELYNSLKT